MAGLLPAWLELYNRDYDDTLTPNDITGWDTSLFVKPECGKKVFEYLYDGAIYEGVRPIPGALEGVRALYDDGHSITFCTSCVNDSMAEAKVRWLGEHEFLTYASGIIVIMDQDKSWVPGDILIDDYYVNLNKFRGQGILFSHPHNADREGYVRAKDWPGVLVRVEQLLGERANYVG